MSSNKNRQFVLLVLDPTKSNAGKISMPDATMDFVWIVSRMLLE
jgi:hypothetical protein